MELSLVQFILMITAYAVPMYFANATPLLFFKYHSKIPIDFGKKIGKERIFGKGKTWLGTEIGIIFGFTAGIIFAIVFSETLLLIPNYFSLAGLLAVGAVTGDLAKSFLKRRIGIESGEMWLFADQLDFVAGGFILSLAARIPEIGIVTVIVVATVFIHILTNFAAFKMKIKKVPW
ncbi:MAG: CDP-2,3-bis-(O-geranylgeranyl)-sn-glycerol synthase [archaeon]|jgi:CDP-2,3-bis-(O-geranylgeranyl)-sn-glycerol synthase